MGCKCMCFAQAFALQACIMQVLAQSHTIYYPQPCTHPHAPPPTHAPTHTLHHPHPHTPPPTDTCSLQDRYKTILLNTAPYDAKDPGFSRAATEAITCLSSRVPLLIHHPDVCGWDVNVDVFGVQQGNDSWQHLLWSKGSTVDSSSCSTEECVLEMCAQSTHASHHLTSCMHTTMA